MKKIIGSLIIIIGILLGSYVLYRNSHFNDTTRAFSTYTILSSSWDAYKKQFITPDGRVIDPSDKDQTTSEGQSYALLRAVWSDDKPTFDLVWNFTNTNLKRKSDNLFGWKWGQQPDGSYSFDPNGGDNTAADADSDITFALILASHRWQQNEYLDSAKKILPDLWSTDTALANNKRYLIAGNWAQNSQELILNPSYFAPYEWRVFAQNDPKNDWNSLIDPSFEILQTSSSSNLDKDKTINLPPDWISMDINTGILTPPNLDKLTTNYSFDAGRTPWRIALDYEWNKDPKDLDYLSSLKALSDLYSQNKKLFTSYTHDGAPSSDIESPMMYATALSYFLQFNPSVANEIYQDKIIRLYSNEQNSFNNNLSYYDQNWLWFGAALYNHQLPYY